MPAKEMEFTIDGYHFYKRNNRIIAESRGKKDEKELNLIAELEMKHYLDARKGGIIHKGRWQWCLNSNKCGKAVYAPICEIEKTKGKIFCSHSCRNIILPSRGKNKYGGVKITKKEEIPVFVPPPAVVEVIESKAEKFPKVRTKIEVKIEPENPTQVVCKAKGLKCSACGVIVEKIYGNPGRCPVCKGDSIFIVAEISSKPKT